MSFCCESCNIQQPEGVKPKKLITSETLEIDEPCQAVNSVTELAVVFCPNRAISRIQKLVCPACIATERAKGKKVDFVFWFDKDYKKIKKGESVKVFVVREGKRNGAISRPYEAWIQQLEDVLRDVVEVKIFDTFQELETALSVGKMPNVVLFNSSSMRQSARKIGAKYPAIRVITLTGGPVSEEESQENVSFHERIKFTNPEALQQLVLQGGKV